jgi:hypothetical protein
MTETTYQATSQVGEARQIAIRDLRVDAHNPRLPEAHRGGSQEDLAVILEMGFDAFSVAQSIVDNGYFLGEPLLAVASDDEPGAFVVVEGNRRLTALFGLAVPEIRAQFAEPDRWESISSRTSLDQSSTVPVIVHASREATHSQVAKAHVVGKLQWRPYMQARFIAARVAEGRTIAEVAEMIGITKSKASDLYRDQAVVGQAQELGLETSEIEKAFSVLTVAMGNTKLRDHIGAPLGSRMDINQKPIPPERADQLRELVTWVFGDEDHEPVITDSRQMSQLGNVVSSEVGLGALRGGHSLEEAKDRVSQAGMDPRERVQKRLGAAKNALLHASDDISDHASDPQVQALVADIEALVESLRNVIDELGSVKA